MRWEGDVGRLRGTDTGGDARSWAAIGTLDTPRRVGDGGNGRGTPGAWGVPTVVRGVWMTGGGDNGKGGSKLALAMETGPPSSSPRSPPRCRVRGVATGDGDRGRFRIVAVSKWFHTRVEGYTHDDAPGEGRV